MRRSLQFIWLLTARVVGKNSGFAVVVVVVVTELVIGSLTKLKWVYRQHKLDLFLFFVLFPPFLSGRSQEWAVALERLGSEIDWVVLYGIPKQAIKILCWILKKKVNLCIYHSSHWITCDNPDAFSLWSCSRSWLLIISSSLYLFLHCFVSQWPSKENTGVKSHISTHSYCFESAVSRAEQCALILMDLWNVIAKLSPYCQRSYISVIAT